MADKKISALTAASTPLAGTEVLPIVQGASTVKVAVSDLTAGRSVSATSIITGLGAVGTPSHTFTGDLNTGMWSPSADALAFSTAGVARVQVTNLGDVGIGTTAPTAKLDVAGDSTGFYAGGAIAMRDANATGNVIYLGQASHIFGGGGSTNAALINNGAGYFVFGTAGVERMRITAVGDITASTGNLVLGTAAKGIDFSANTHAAGMTSELLNDYEEGTWTPTQGAGLTVVGAFSSSGTYTKIGRLVTVKGALIGATSISALGGNVMTGGLPYAESAAVTGGAANAFAGSASVCLLSGGVIYSVSTVANGGGVIYFNVTYEV